MCGYESEIILFQLHLYARKRYPELVFQPERLKYMLDEWDIVSMRQLFDLPAEARIALVLPLMIPNSSQSTGSDLLMNSEASIAA